MEDSKILLNVEETAAYLNIGKTKTREIMKDNEKIFVVELATGIMRIRHCLINGFLPR